MTLNLKEQAFNAWAMNLPAFTYYTAMQSTITVAAVNISKIHMQTHIYVHHHAYKQELPCWFK